MKAICIRDGENSWYFDYEEGSEQEVLTAILMEARKPETPFNVEDIIGIVKAYPELFSSTA